MEISALRVRFNGVLVTFAYRTLAKPLDVVILAYGLPEYPLSYKDPFVINLVKHGFIVAIPQYIGTFDSFGTCNIENMLETILRTIKLVKRGVGIDLVSMDKVMWKAKRIVLVGGSFGANVVLAAYGSKSSEVAKIAAIAPFGDFASQGKLNYVEEKIMHRYHVARRVYPLTWRFASVKPWINLSKGKTAMNPSNYLGNLKDKHVLLMHGEADEVVNVERSKLFFTELKRIGNRKAKLIVVKGVGHIGLRALREEKVFQRFIKWAKATN